MTDEELVQEGSNSPSLLTKELASRLFYAKSYIKLLEEYGEKATKEICTKVEQLDQQTAKDIGEILDNLFIEGEYNGD